LADQHLHIVCFDIPYPTDYGGVFDLFFKITALHKQGIKIHLHCFKYGRARQDELNKYCEEVLYYERALGLKGLSFSLPYIVNSRKDDRLLHNLLKDDHPVVLEGIHCTYYLYQNVLKNKKVFVRLHNVEFEYYYQLAKSATSFSKKIYFLNESRLLKKYEKLISSKATFIAVTLADKETYQEQFDANKIQYLPVFLPYTSINAKEGKGSYCLYHGNLVVGENEKAATWLLKNVFNELDIPIIIAGKNPSEKLHNLMHQNTNFRLVPNPTEEELNELIKGAQINILPSFNATGIKIKLLNALYNGRHCIINDAGNDGSGLQALCTIASDAKSFKKNIANLYDCPFTAEDIIMRKQLLLPIYNNEQNARQLIQWIY
jgi:hypothetical protein